MSNLLERLQLRSDLLDAMRRHLRASGFLEVETPVRVATPALELHIDAEPAGEAFLRTSPELHLKRLLAAGATHLFELGPCFRRGESGSRHHPEYTMLEWYRSGTDYMGALEDTRDLLRAVVPTVLGTSIIPSGPGIDLSADWVVRTVRDVFTEYAGWDPVADFDADRFDLDLVQHVEPALPMDRPVILKDYPAPLAALARLKPGDPTVAERWELYLGGMELANAYSELTDPGEQRARFEACASERAERGKPVYELDEPFLEALEAGLPPCGGVALGVDRLVMLLCGADDIRAVRAGAK